MNYRHLLTFWSRLILTVWRPGTIRNGTAPDAEKAARIVGCDQFVPWYIRHRSTGLFPGRTAEVCAVQRSNSEVVQSSPGVEVVRQVLPFSTTASVFSKIKMCMKNIFGIVITSSKIATFQGDAVVS